MPETLARQFVKPASSPSHGRGRWPSKTTAPAIKICLPYSQRVSLTPTSTSVEVKVAICRQSRTPLRLQVLQTHPCFSKLSRLGSSGRFGRLSGRSRSSRIRGTLQESVRVREAGTFRLGMVGKSCPRGRQAEAPNRRAQKIEAKF